MLKLTPAVTDERVEVHDRASFEANMKPDLFTRRGILNGLLWTAGMATGSVPALALGDIESTHSGATVQRRPGLSTERVTYAVVSTTGGRLRGRQVGGVFRFKGIQYGAPTGGDNRFRPPRPPASWSGVKDALEFGSVAPQTNPWWLARKYTVNGYEGAFPGQQNSAMGEDCLCLNVWTPGFDVQGRRPVMAWFHGGSFIGGAGGQTWYDGANLSQRGNVVVVTINHRLGAFGYLYLKSIGGDQYSTSGSSGNLDLVAALTWVRDNIAAFGGDPGNVTIFGESGGGAKVCSLLAMPGAKGLFHRAIVESGAMLRAHTADQADRVTQLMLKELGLGQNSIKELQEMPIDRLVAAQERLVTAVRGGELPGIKYEFAPVVDNIVLLRNPFDPDAPSISEDIPLLIGTNKTEATWGLWVDTQMNSPDEAQLRKHLALGLRRDPDPIIEFYRRRYPLVTLRDIYVIIMSSPYDSILLAERKAKQGLAPVFMYLFAWETPSYGGQLKTPHMLEVPFVFNNIEMAKEFTGGGRTAERLAGTICDAWVHFARHGIPAAQALPVWPPYTMKQRSTMVLDDESHVQSDPDKDARLFWESLAPPPLVPF